MIQEIITYLIVAFAVGLAILKMYNTLSVKEKRNKAIDFKTEKFTLLHDCTDCVADCTLRNASPKVKNESPEICETNVKLKDS